MLRFNRHGNRISPTIKSGLHYHPIYVHCLLRVRNIRLFLNYYQIIEIKNSLDSKECEQIIPMGGDPAHFCTCLRIFAWTSILQIYPNISAKHGRPKYILTPEKTSHV